MSSVPEVSSAADALVRVSVRSGSRRIDLAVSASSPVAHLAPELAALAAGADEEVPAADHGLRLLAPDGRTLSPEHGLTEQGITEGAVLTLTPEEVPPPRVHDDLAEAVVEVVTRTVPSADPAAGRRTAVVVACLALTATGGVLVALGPGRLGSGLAAIVALTLVIGGVVTARWTGDHRAGQVASWLAWPHAALAGLLATTHQSSAGAWPPMEHLLGRPLASAGAALALTASVGVVGLPRGRTLLVPGAVLGLVMVLLGACGPVAPVGPGVVVTVALTALVLAGTLLPWLAAASTGSVGPDALPETAGVTGGGSGTASRPVDLERVAADVRVVHDVLLAGSVTLGAALVLLVPTVAARGWPGVALAMLCCAAVGLRTCRTRAGVEVLVGRVCAVVGLAEVVLTVLLTRPEHRAALAVALAGIGLLLLADVAAGGLKVRESGEVSAARRQRLTDLLESMVLLSLLPVTVVAVGLLDRALG